MNKGTRGERARWVGNRNDEQWGERKEERGDERRKRREGGGKKGVATGARATPFVARLVVSPLAAFRRESTGTPRRAPLRPTFAVANLGGGPFPVAAPSPSSAPPFEIRRPAAPRARLTCASSLQLETPRTWWRSSSPLKPTSAGGKGTAQIDSSDCPKWCRLA